MELSVFTVSLNQKDNRSVFGLTRAPDFPNAGLTWVNTDRPLSLDDLRGKLVILDFWTFCCINCMHVLPTLSRIEKAFSDTVQVIGVHSPKFAAERDAENVAAAVARYHIAHPVVHDPEMRIWQAYAVRAWPTLTLISPDGYVIGQVSGEPDAERLEQGLTTLLSDFAARGEIRESAALTALSQPMPARPLSFPGKVKPLVSAPPQAPTARWAIADGGHHSIVLCDDQGTECLRIGAGQGGDQDGSAATARLNSPQGLAADCHGLWIADTGNHRLRRYDFASDRVYTVWGSGLRGPVLEGEPTVANADLASPWDIEVTLDGEGRTDRLYLANAGTHQLAVFGAQPHFDLLAVIGTGGENIVDGAADEALLAQPSGLALDLQRETMWFADSETSAVRGADLSAPYTVETLVGEGLFDFGHLDGAFDRALLQHPLGLCLHQPSGDLIVADSYNGVLRRLHLAERRVSTLDLGTCEDALCLPLGEPAGVWADGEHRLLISDTNNHRIVEVRLDRGTYKTWGA
jgi:thiol-disulfide isomerase/thioredoxin/sugar lactone lactonase YvrE